MSFYTSLTGLNAAATELSVTSNNIANAGTTSFKRSDAVFGDIFATSTTQKSSNSVGSGVSLLAVNQQFTQGNIESSANTLDLAIAGDGFFPIKTPDGQELFTRNGAFMLDENGLMVNDEGNGLQVHPLNTDGTSNFKVATQGLTIARDFPAAASTTGTITLNFPLDGVALVGPPTLDPADPTTYNEAQTFSLYDDEGNGYQTTVYYQKTADVAGNGVGDDTWKATAYVDGVQAGPSVDLTIANATGTGTGATITLAAVNLPTSSQDVVLTVNPNGVAGGFKAVSLTENGFPPGGLVNIDIAENGSVRTTYSNGEQQDVGRINLANFSSTPGLKQTGGTKYATTANSGGATYGAAGSAGFGTIRSGALERSNVDLTAELVDLISAQRNFQANAKAIETSSTLTSTIINMRG
ncbi:MAG: flagellar hook protein FlgE [Porticoccaceae bacterium]|nr:flagellar hook protein FlgE [Porticoccaceae bacterium]